MSNSKNILIKNGGFAAIYEGVAYIIGIVFFLIISDYASISDPIKKLIYMSENRISIYVVTFLIYVLFGGALVLLSFSIHEKLKDNAPSLMKIATSFGLIWSVAVIFSGMIYNYGMDAAIELFSDDQSKAVALWMPIENIHEAIGGGSELLGGIWILLLSIAALKGSHFNKAINIFGIIIGLCGAMSDIPYLGSLGMVFGLTQIIWFFWIGILLLRDNKN